MPSGKLPDILSLAPDYVLRGPVSPYIVMYTATTVLFTLLLALAWALTYIVRKMVSKKSILQEEQNDNETEENKVKYE